MADKYTLSSSNNDDSFFVERTSRTRVFLGINAKQADQAQEKLRNTTVGVAGAGGIGGAMAMRLARLGVGKIKIADPDTFDISNINRQLGASYSNLGRNKASVVGEMTFDIGRDTDVEVYTDGITKSNVDDFIYGTDIVLDQLDFSVIAEKIALHEAFYNSSSCKEILACSVIGWGAHLYRFTREGMKLREWYGLSDISNIQSLATDWRTAHLLKLWAPRFPHFPSYDTVMAWIQENDALPIFAGAPPLAEGFLIQRVVLSLCGIDSPPHAHILPPIPEIYIYDAALLSGDFYHSDGEIKNLNVIKKLWS